MAHFSQFVLHLRAKICIGNQTHTLSPALAYFLTEPRILQRNRRLFQNIQPCTGTELLAVESYACLLRISSVILDGMGIPILSFPLPTTRCQNGYHCILWAPHYCWSFLQGKGAFTVSVDDEQAQNRGGPCWAAQPRIRSPEYGGRGCHCLRPLPGPNLSPPSSTPSPPPPPGSTANYRRRYCGIPQAVLLSGSHNCSLWHLHNTQSYQYTCTTGTTKD